MTLAPSDMICFALYSATHAMQQAYRPLLEPLGLTYPQYLVLSALWSMADDAPSALRPASNKAKVANKAKAGRPVVGTLSRMVHLESSTLTPLLKRLEAMGLVQRRRARDDERQVEITLTAAGRALRRKAAGIPACIAEKTGLTLAEIDRLRRDISALSTRLRVA